MSAWQLGLVCVGGTVLATHAAHWAFKRWRKKDYSMDDLNLVIQYVAVLATLNSLLLAFMTVEVWEAHDAADAAALNEATTIAMVARDLAVYGGKQASDVRRELKEYGRCVIDEEWPQLALSRDETKCGDQLDDASVELAEVSGRTPRDAAILGAIWQRVDEIARYRRERLQASGSSVPATLWLVVLAGTAATLVALVVMPWNALSRFMVLLVAVCHGLVFMFIFDLAKPFAGPDAVAPDALENVLRGMDRWDERLGPSRRR